MTAKQTTTVESLRAELAEAKEEISKLSQDMHGQRRSVYRHNQLEELRNLQVCERVLDPCVFLCKVNFYSR